MQPAKTFRDGTISVSYWEPEGEEKGLRVTFQKRYKGMDGQWKTTSTLFLAEIPRAIQLLQSAHHFLQARQGELREPGRAAGDE